MKLKKLTKNLKTWKRHVKRAVSTALTAAMLVGMPAVHTPVEAQAASKVSIAHFNEMLKDVTGMDAWLATDSYYKSKSALTNQVAAQMALRADEQLNGTAYNEDLYEQVVKKNRIRDIKKATKKYREALTLCFVKGIMPGKAKENYSQQRSLSPKSKVTPSQARSIVARVKNKGKRIKLTDDGQVTRTTNLPKNASSYPYILASFPNSYYEPKFDYDQIEYKAGYIPVNLVDYASPKNVKKVKDGWDEGDGYTFGTAYSEYCDEWMEMIRTNLECRFNYSYKMSDKEYKKWKAKLLATYSKRYRDRESGYLDNYRSWSKQLDTVVKASKIVVEPSSIYMSNGKYFVRCYVEFTVNANRYFSAESLDQNAYLYSSHAYFPGLQLNKKYAAVIDVRFEDFTINGGGSGASIIDDYLGRAGDPRMAP